jgi:hypothetical protein
VRVDQCVAAVGVMDVPVLVCFRSSCYHVIELGEACGWLKLALKFVMRNDGGFMDVIMIYLKT